MFCCAARFALCLWQSLVPSNSGALGERQLFLDSHVHPKERRHAHSLWCAGEWRICAKTSDHVMGVPTYRRRYDIIILCITSHLPYLTSPRLLIDHTINDSAAVSSMFIPSSDAILLAGLPMELGTT